MPFKKSPKRLMVTEIDGRWRFRIFYSYSKAKGGKEELIEQYGYDTEDQAELAARCCQSIVKFGGGIYGWKCRKDQSTAELMSFLTELGHPIVVSCDSVSATALATSTVVTPAQFDDQHLYVGLHASCMIDAPCRRYKHALCKRFSFRKGVMTDEEVDYNLDTLVSELPRKLRLYQFPLRIPLSKNTRFYNWYTKDGAQDRCYASHIPHIFTAETLPRRMLYRAVLQDTFKWSLDSLHVSSYHSSSPFWFIKPGHKISDPLLSEGEHMFQIDFGEYRDYLREFLRDYGVTGQSAVRMHTEFHYGLDEQGELYLDIFEHPLIWVSRSGFMKACPGYYRPAGPSVRLLLLDVIAATRKEVQSNITSPPPQPPHGQYNKEASSAADTCQLFITPVRPCQDDHTPVCMSSTGSPLLCRGVPCGVGPAEGYLVEEMAAVLSSIRHDHPPLTFEHRSPVCISAPPPETGLSRLHQEVLCGQPLPHKGPPAVAELERAATVVVDVDLVSTPCVESLQLITTPARRCDNHMTPVCISAPPPETGLVCLHQEVLYGPPMAAELPIFVEQEVAAFLSSMHHDQLFLLEDCSTKLDFGKESTLSQTTPASEAVDISPCTEASSLSSGLGLHPVAAVVSEAEEGVVSTVVDSITEQLTHLLRV